MSPPAHICHVFSTFAPGGVELRTATQLGALGPRFRHTILALDQNYGAASRIAPDAAVTLAPTPRFGHRLSYPLALRAALQQIAPDLLVTYTWDAIYGTLAAQLGGSGPTIHLETGFGRDEAVARKWRRVWTRRLVLPRIFATIVPSRALQRLALTEFRIPPDKLIYIPNGVDVTKFRPGRDARWRRSLGIPDDVLLFGTVCGLRPEKNLGLLLSAFARADLPDARLVVVGDGPSRPEWESLARQLGLGERAIFAGRVEDPLPCYASLDVFVMSSLSEQMPNALLEAMACGLPAICTEVGDCREMLGSTDRPAIVPNGDEPSYAATLRAMAGSTALRAELGAANRARCVERYALERMVARYAAVYDAALEARGRLPQSSVPGASPPG